MASSNWYLMFPYALLGLLISLLLDVYSSGIKMSQFKAKKWANDNLVRLILSLLCLCAGLLFSEDLFGTKLNPLVAFWGGIGNDNLVNMFIRRKASVNKKTEE